MTRDVLSFPVITPPGEWEVPAGIEVRRIINRVGIPCLVFSSPTAVTDPTLRGWVAVVEANFAPDNIQALVSAVNSPVR